MPDTISVLEALRLRHGLTISELSRLVGGEISQTVLRYYENPRIPPHHAHLLGAVFESMEPDFFRNYELTAEDLQGSWSDLRLKLEALRQ